jgi:hypothetical protein
MGLAVSGAAGTADLVPNRIPAALVERQTAA